MEISRQDMSNWQQHIFIFLLPIFILLKTVLKSGPVIRMDETTAQVMGEDGRDDDKTSYIWLARGGPPGKTVVIYEYHPTHEAKHIKEILVCCQIQISVCISLLDFSNNLLRCFCPLESPSGFIPRLNKIFYCLG